MVWFPMFLNFSLPFLFWTMLECVESTLENYIHTLSQSS